MNVIYCVSELNDWIDVADYFFKKDKWNPVLWATTKTNESYLKSKFPIF